MSTHTDTTPETKRDSFRTIKEAGDDVSLRKKVAAAIAMEPATTSELADRFEQHSSNATRPRVNELIRMGCVERSGTRTNPSGHDAYVHYITAKGERYLRGECDPEPAPTLSELQSEVVDAARAFCAGASNQERLEQAVKSHDGSKIRRDPEWSPPHTLAEQTDSLTDEERERIKSDPVLELEDFEGVEE